MTTNEHTGGTQQGGGAAVNGRGGTDGQAVRWSMRVPASELSRFVPLGVLCDADERKPDGGVVLECDGRQRWWSAGDEAVALRCEGGPTTTVGRVVLPRRVLPVAQALAGADGEVELVMEERAGLPARVHVRGPGGRVSVPLPEQRSHVHARFVQHETEARPDAGYAEVAVPAKALQRIVHMVRVAPVAMPQEPGAEPVDSPMPWLVLDDGELRLEVEWDGFGEFEYALDGVGTGTARCVLALGALDHVLHTMDGMIVVRVPTGPGGFVSVTEPGSSVALFTRVPEPTRVLVDSVVEGLRAGFGDDFDESVGPDGERMLAICVDGVPITLEVLENDLVVLRMRAIALQGVRGTRGLLRELNDLNLGLDLVRLALVGREVEVVSDVALDAGEIDVVIGALFRVAAVARDLAPIVHVVHGGALPAALAAPEAD